VTNKPLKHGDAVRVVDGSEAQGNIGVVLDFLPGGYAAIKLADCVRPVNPDKTEPLGPLPVMRRWVVELEQNWWLAQWSGDPGRTRELVHAQVYRSERMAKRALDLARRFSPFPAAVVRKLPCAII
jgi:hypothetical protein